MVSSYLKTTILSENDYKTTDWSAGKTTELYIFPENSSYNDRNFSFRISSATVDSENSTFTELPGTNRKLMLLDGEMTLIHKNRYQKKLEVYEQDSFSGEWETAGVGNARDFNLMLKSGAQGTLYHKSFAPHEKSSLNLKIENRKSLFSIFYVVSGTLTVFINTEKHELSENQTLVLDYSDEDTVQLILENHSETSTELVSTRISLKQLNGRNL